MLDTIYSPDVYIKHTGTEKGRGAYAAHDFKMNDLVEECPVIVLSGSLEMLAPEVKTIIFNWGSLTNSAPSNALVLGYGSIYNHDNPANMKYKGVLKNHSIQYFAARDIKRGEELTVNYNTASGNHISDNDNWFEFHEIKRI